MRNARSRVEKLEQEKEAEAPIVVTFGKPLERGQKPSPGAITFVLEHPNFDLEDESPGGQCED